MKCWSIGSPLVAKIAHGSFDTLSDRDHAKCFAFIYLALDHFSLNVVRLQSHDVNRHVSMSLAFHSDSLDKESSEDFGTTVDKVARKWCLCCDARADNDARALASLFKLLSEFE